MDMKLLWLFIGLNIINVIVQTIKSIATLKCGKIGASVINAVAYGFYTIVTIYMLCDLPLFWKAGIVALCNLIGVYVVKWGEEKARKDKLWLVKMTIPMRQAECAKALLEQNDIPFTYYNLTKYLVFDTYCDNQAQTKIVTDICETCNGKAFASENKLGL